MNKYYTGDSVCKIKGHSGLRGHVTVAKRRFYKYFYEETKKGCRQACKAWRIKMKAQRDGSRSWSFFKTAWLHWATHKKKPLAPRTVAEHQQAHKKLEEFIHPKFLSDLTMKNLRRWRAFLEEDAIRKKRDNYGANKHMGAMKTDIKWAIDQGHMEDVTINAFQLLEVNETEVKTQDVAEIELMLKYATTQERVVILLGFDCGLRPEEICNMLIVKLDLETRFGWISTNEENKKDGIITWVPKCGKSRQFRLTLRLVAEIKKLNAQGPYLIATRFNEPYSQQGFSVHYKKIVKRINARIEERDPANPIRITGTCKTLRKNYSTSKQAQGASRTFVGFTMGHADTAITTKHYTEQGNADLLAREREELKKLDQYEVPLEY